MPVIEGIALGLGDVVGATDDDSDIEGYAIAEVAMVDGLADGAGEVGETGGSDIDDGTKVTVDMIISSPEMMVLVSVVPTPGGSDVGVIGTAVLGDSCVLDRCAGGVGEANVERGLLVIAMPVRLGGAMLLSHSVEPLITE
jgi:hypothetical protein